MAAALSEKLPLVAVAGPTAVGKTEVSVLLAKEIDGEIISVDSAQVYRCMDIGSAKPDAAQRQGVIHRLIDIWDPDEPFDVVRYQALAKEAVFETLEAGHMPILTGGTGFYLDAVIRDTDFTEGGEDREFRSALLEKACVHGPESLHADLSVIDPAAAEAIHPNNVRRVIRALEFAHMTGQKISEHNARQKEKISPYNYILFYLYEDRNILYRRIESRVDAMMNMGLEKEVRSLYDAGLTEDMTSMRAIGYKEFFPYFRGEYGLDDAVRLIKTHTRHYAKRQETWFRDHAEAVRIDMGEWRDDIPALIQHMKDLISGSGITVTRGQLND